MPESIAADTAASPPVPPCRDECCGRGCEPCIFDYYRRALARWQGQGRDGEAVYIARTIVLPEHKE